MAGAEQRPRTPAVVLLSLVAAVCVLVGAVALTSRQDAPPGIAEFAPRAVEQVKEALADDAPEAAPPPPETRSPSASPSASTGPATPAPTATAAPPIRVPNVRTCVGSPPRQTEDPQSPPCVPYWDARQGNGGATAPGVTEDEVVVALPQQFFENLQVPPQLVDFFNKRYELYGRKLVLKAYAPAGCAGGVPRPDQMRADAVAVQEELKAFASLAYCNAQQADQAYYDALADRGVVSVPDGNLVVGTESRYARRAPFQWNVQPGTDVVLANLAQFSCAALAGRPPRYAGPTVSGAARRVFGLIYTRAPDGTVPDVEPLRTGLRACGEQLVEVREDVTGDPSRNGVNAVVTLRDAGVTSVVCLCSVVDTRGTYMTAASGQGWQPEWVLTTYGGNDLDNSFSGGNAPPDQAGNVLGLTFRNKLLPKQDMPWYWAVREAAPQSDPQGNTYYASNSRYYQLSLLAAGIQGAGPNLTPRSFQAALHRLRFPNPGAGAAPYFQARVGFEGRRHVMTDDAAMFWYSPQTPGTVDPTVPGAVCYVDRGRRTGLGEWARQDPAFRTGPCL